MPSYHQFVLISYFFFNDTATTEIYTLSLHDALPIYSQLRPTYSFFAPSAGGAKSEKVGRRRSRGVGGAEAWVEESEDRKSTRLNSSHSQISYAVFCLKKKKIIMIKKETSEERIRPVQ